jgi:hypothetical protein
MVTGGSAGLGFAVAEALLRADYRVLIVGRDPERLERCRLQLAQIRAPSCVSAVAADVGCPQELDRVTDQLDDDFGRLDVLVNCVGLSDRGWVESLEADRLESLVRQNVTTALLCSQQMLPALKRTGGVIVNIGSLASKVGARYLGGYPAAKHALAGLTQQLRLELKPHGVHVALVSPGPIRRPDEGRRYAEAADGDLPAQAAKPGGGTRVKGIPPERVAAAVVRCIERRAADVILPGHLRILIAVGHAWPRLGDWLLLKFTSSGND